ncbi:MAG: acetyl-CoA carboxylase biotin carboxyl carrier protein subunit [Candidatus Poseidoniaceae archaeon]
MEFKTSKDRIEIDPSRDGNSFTHEGMILHTGENLWLEIDGRKYKAVATKVGDVWWVHVLGHTLQFEVVEAGATSSDDEGGLTAPMPGKILEVHVSEGQSVASGEILMVMEAMKMEHKIVASSDGKVEYIHFKEGDQVPQGAELLTISE